MHSVPPACPGPCDHTILEHAAFDAGWACAEMGQHREACQLTNAALRDAWEWGWDFAATPEQQQGADDASQ